MAVDRVEVGLEVLDPRREAAPAAGARLDQQAWTAGSAAGVEQRQQHLAHLPQRRRQCCVVTAEPAWNTTAAGADAAPARSPWARVATDRSTVAAVGEPRFTSSDAWM